MALHHAGGLLRAQAVAWEKFVIGRVEPHARVPVRHPSSPASGKTDFRFETPTVGTGVDEPRRVVLSGRDHDGEAHADKALLGPLKKVSNVHGRSSVQVDRKPDAGISHA